MLRPRAWLLSASLAAVAIGLLLLPLPVSASPPAVETFYNEGSFVFSGPCPNGVTLVGSFTEDLRITTFFDNAGNPIREQIAVNVRGNVTNPATGVSADNPSHQTIIVDLVDGTVVQVGLVFKVQVPGVGTVFHDVGRVVVDAGDNIIFEAGPHDLLHTEGDHRVRALFCAALT